jgi:opine dehydrogenase
MRSIEICVVGAGNLGQAQAGHLAALGHSVRLFNRSVNRLVSLREGKAIRLVGAVPEAQRGAQPIAMLTTDLAVALEGASLVFLDVPATAHDDLARAFALLLKASVSVPLIILHSGQTFGARHFSEALRRARVAAPPPICELQTALYTARITPSGEAKVLAFKQRVGFSTFPRADPRSRASERELCALYPQLIPEPSTLHTGLMNLQGIIHPLICLHNLPLIERGERFRIYRDGLSPAVGALIDSADQERLLVAKALGLTVPTVAQWYALSYGCHGASTFEVMNQVAAYDEILGPTSLSTRLLWDDVPTSLVPLLSLARALGVETPLLSALLALATTVCGPRILKGAWTLAELGLDGRTASTIWNAF